VSKTRYVAAPNRSDWWDEHRGTDALARTIHESENIPVKTGILDAHGTPIYRCIEREPIGFIRPKV